MPRTRRQQKRQKRTSHCPLQVNGANDEATAKPTEKPRTAPKILDSIPKAEEMHFVEQDFLSCAEPKKLLVGHHVRNGDSIFAYIVPKGTSHKVEYYIEDAQGGRKTQLTTAMVIKHRILRPFNSTYPQRTQSITRADTSRLALVVVWYFISAGMLQAYFRGEEKISRTQLYAALRYIERASNHSLNRSSQEETVQQSPHRQAGQVQSGSNIQIDEISEIDIQSHLLQTYLLESRDKCNSHLQPGRGL